jgi:hypothetical protein
MSSMLRQIEAEKIEHGLTHAYHWDSDFTGNWRCWATTIKDEDSCDKVNSTVIGLCAAHYLAITGKRYVRQ